MQRHFNYIILVFGTVNIMCGQNPNMEIGGFEYSLNPNVGETNIERYMTNINFKKKFSKRSIIGGGISYDYYDFIFNNASLDFNTQPYENIHNIKAKVFFKYAIDSTWFVNLIIAPSLASNLEGSLGNEDFILNSMATLSKKWQNETQLSSLTFGIGFGTFFGKPRLIPVVAFRKRIRTTWSYVLGFPQSKISYHMDLRHTVSARANFRGVFGNVSSTVNFPNEGTFENTKLQYNSLDTSLDYTYRIQPNWTTIIRVGYSPWNQLLILDDANNEVYDLKADSSIFISMGLKFNLNK